MNIFQSFNPPKHSNHPRWDNPNALMKHANHQTRKALRKCGKLNVICMHCGYPLGVHNVMTCPTTEEVDASIARGTSERTRVKLNPYPFRR